MVRHDWVVGDRRTAAAERIYAAASEIVIRDGLDALDIDVLAARVHCSRATIYRYTGGKGQIRDAVLIRLSSGIVDEVRRAVSELSGPERITAAVAIALEQIRSSPLRQIVLSSHKAPDLGELHSLPVLSHLAAELTGISDDPQAAEWIVRVVLSLAYWPLPDNRAERDVLRRFLAPAFGP